MLVLLLFYGYGGGSVVPAAEGHQPTAFPVALVAFKAPKLYGKAAGSIRYGGPRGAGFGHTPRTKRNDDRVQRRPLSPTPQPLQGPFYVQGYKASDLEFICYQALLALGWTDGEVEFQSATMGGRMPGGAVLDFVVHAQGGDIVIAVDGDAWHNRTEAQRQDDLFQQQRISQALGYAVMFVKANAGDLQPPEVAYVFLERWVGHGGGTA